MMRIYIGKAVTLSLLASALAFGAAQPHASDKFTTMADRNGQAEGVTSTSRDELLNQEAGETPSIVHNSAWATSSGQTSVADQARSARTAVSVEAERVRQETESRIAATESELSAEIQRLEDKIASSSSTGGGGGSSTPTCSQGSWNGMNCEWNGGR